MVPSNGNGARWKVPSHLKTETVRERLDRDIDGSENHNTTFLGNYFNYP
jgi:hypothetical protein